MDAKVSFILFNLKSYICIYYMFITKFEGNISSRFCLIVLMLYSLYSKILQCSEMGVFFLIFEL